MYDTYIIYFIIHYTDRDRANILINNFTLLCRLTKPSEPDSKVVLLCVEGVSPHLISQIRPEEIFVKISTPGICSIWFNSLVEDVNPLLKRLGGK
jgi:hypothetical protein